MIDLTLVSCVAPCILEGQDGTGAARLLEPLVEARVPLVVYVEEEWRAAVEAGTGGELLRVRPTSAPDRHREFGTRRALEATWRAAARAGLPSLDYFVLTLGKMGMLHDQSIWDPFGTRHLAWIDADVAASVNPLYLTRARLLDSLPSLLSGFFLLTRPSPCADAAGRENASRVQTQLFGGEAGAIAEVNTAYFQLLEAVLGAGELPTDEFLFTELLTRTPERFDRFVLQENGLLGVLFEQMRTGYVPIERTAMH